MRLFVDCHNFDEGGGQGVVTYIHNLYSNKTFPSRDIDLYLGANNIEKLKTYFPDERIHFLKYPTKNKYMRLLVYIPLLQIKHKITVSHFQYFVPLIKIGRWIVTMHDVLFLEYPELFPFFYRLKNKFLFFISLLFSDTIITVSAYSNEAIKKFYHTKKDIYVTPNCVSSKNNSTLKIIEKPAFFNMARKYILTVGRMEKRKNHILLCESYIRAGLYNNYDLVLIGKEDLFSNIFYKYLQSVDKNIRNRIFIYTDVSDLDLTWFYMHSSLFVFPSQCEGFGIPPLEAAVLNCSTICSDKPAMSDFVFFGDRLFNPDNQEELIRKMLRYVDTNTGMKTISKIIKEMYNNNSISTSYREFLLESYMRR